MIHIYRCLFYVSPDFFYQLSFPDILFGNKKKGEVSICNMISTYTKTSKCFLRFLYRVRTWRGIYHCERNEKDDLLYHHQQREIVKEVALSERNKIQNCWFWWETLPTKWSLQTEKYVCISMMTFNKIVCSSLSIDLHNSVKYLRFLWFSVIREVHTKIFEVRIQVFSFFFFSDEGIIGNH